MIIIRWPLLAYFPYFEKIKKKACKITLLSVCVFVCVLSSVFISPLIFVRRLMRSPCCLCVCVSPLIFSFSIPSVPYQREVRISSSQNFLFSKKNRLLNCLLLIFLQLPSKMFQRIFTCDLMFSQRRLWKLLSSEIYSRVVRGFISYSSTMKMEEIISSEMSV
jgi:hypothetical protein